MTRIHISGPGFAILALGVGGRKDIFPRVYGKRYWFLKPCPAPGTQSVYLDVGFGDENGDFFPSSCPHPLRSATSENLGHFRDQTLCGRQRQKTMVSTPRCGVQAT